MRFGNPLGSRWRTRLRTKDAGITLVELLVAVVIFGILSAMIVNLYVSTTRAAGASSDKSQNTRTASNTLNEISRVIRFGTNNVTGAGTADPVIVDARNESLTLISFVDTTAKNPKPTMVRFAVDPTTRQLVEARWSPKTVDGLWTFPATSSTPDSKRVLPGTIVPSGANAAPLFTYLKADRASKMSPASSAVSLGLEERKLVLVVEVAVTTRENPKSKPVTVTAKVGMPNVNVKATP